MEILNDAKGAAAAYRNVRKVFVRSCGESPA
jgi:hypothetical protein